MRAVPIFAALAVMTGTTSAEELAFDVRFNDAILAAGQAGFAVGDRVILDDALLVDGKEVGTTSGVCTITDAAGVMLCAITFVLPEGTLSTQFVNTPPPEKHFALFGGTDAYAARVGSGVLLEHGDGTGRLTITVAD